MSQRGAASLRTGSQASASGRGGSGASGVRMAKARILAVDDQRYFRVFLEDLLVQQGFEVRTAGSGEEALHLLERETFDVVVTDLVMPGISGADLVERVKERWPEQDVIVLTSVGDVRTAVEAMRTGASDYLLKPLDPTFLERSLDAILQRRRLRREHAALMAENLEYLGVLSLYERTLALFSTLAIEPLADRIVEGLCLELRAQGGVAWLARSDDPGRLRLAAARGLVRVDREPEEIALDATPPELAGLHRPEASPFEMEHGGTTSLVVPPISIAKDAVGPASGSSSGGSASSAISSTSRSTRTSPRAAASRRRPGSSGRAIHATPPWARASRQSPSTIRSARGSTERVENSARVRS